MHIFNKLHSFVAFQVGNNIVVLSKLSARSPRATDPPATSLQKIKLSKLWVPPRGNVKPQVTTEHSSKHVAKRRFPETSESSSQESSSDTEEPFGACKNTFASNDRREIPVSTDSIPGSSVLGSQPAGVGTSDMISPSTSGAPRPGVPSVRPNAMRNRQKQLEALKRYEDRIKKHMRQEKEGFAQDHHQHLGGAAASSDESDNEFVPTCMQQQRPSHRMYVHVLDISKAIIDGTVEWLPLTMEHAGQAPEETILYSLVHGRGEIIMFGGIQAGANTMQMGMHISPQVVSNNLHFIKAQHQLR